MVQYRYHVLRCQFDYCIKNLSAKIILDYLTTGKSYYGLYEEWFIKTESEFMDYLKHPPNYDTFIQIIDKELI